MYNWSSDIKKMDKNSDIYIIWKLEQLINFGLNDEKINKKQLIKYLPRLKLDPQRKKYILSII